MGCVQSTSKDVKFKDAAAQIQLDRTSFTLVNKNEFGAIKNSDSLKKLSDVTNNHLKENAYETQIINGSHKKHRRCESTQSHSKQRRKHPFVRDKFDPRVLQKYEVKALIGRGSFSKVCIRDEVSFLFKLNLYFLYCRLYLFVFILGCPSPKQKNEATIRYKDDRDSP